jgi:type I restriction enzyme R subunit
VLITVGHNESELARFAKSKTEEEEVIRQFKEEKDPKILIVCDKLLTGFDAPVEQVMYLDSPLKEHSLLQAMGRVNRRLDKKEYGLVVDYWGVSLDLQEALHMYGSDVSEGMVHMDYKNEILPKLQAAHKAAMDFFVDVKNKKIQKEGESYEDACVRFLEPPDRRDVLDQRFKLYSRYMDMLLPDPDALPYAKDLKWLAYIRQRAMTRYRDEWKPEDSCSQKVRKLIDEHVGVDGIRQLIAPIDIFSEKFDEEIDKLSSDEAKASEIEHAIKHEIHVKIYEDPVFYESLRERLKRIIDEYREGRVNAAQQLLLLKQVLEDLRSPEKHAQELGVSSEVAPFYSLLSGGSNDKETLKKAAQDILGTLKKHVVVDWQQKEDTKREMRRDIKRILKAADYPSDEVQDTMAKLMDLAARRL